MEDYLKNRKQAEELKEQQAKKQEERFNFGALLGGIAVVAGACATTWAATEWANQEKINTIKAEHEKTKRTLSETINLLEQSVGDLKNSFEYIKKESKTLAEEMERIKSYILRESTESPMVKYIFFDCFIRFERLLSNIAQVRKIKIENTDGIVRKIEKLESDGFHSLEFKEFYKLIPAPTKKNLEKMRATSSTITDLRNTIFHGDDYDKSQLIPAFNLLSGILLKYENYLVA